MSIISAVRGTVGASLCRALSTEAGPVITMVKKIKADGSPCRKCDEVSERLKNDGLEHRIHNTVVADEANPDSEGMKIANDLNVDVAPFFVVDDGKSKEVYTLYFKFKKEVLSAESSQEEVLKDQVDRANIDFM